MKGETPLGDFTLAFNFGAFCALEGKTGKKVPDLLDALAGGLGFCELRDFVWAGLQTHHAGVSDETVVLLLDDVGYEPAASAVGKAIAGAFGKAKAKGENPPKAAP